MQYMIVVQVDYAEDSDPATLLGDVAATVTQAFKDRSGIVNFQIESIDLGIKEG